MNEQEFWAILHAMPEPKPIFYRLYHNDDGTPIVYSMEELPGKYIEVDQPTYSLASYNVRVVDGKLIKIIPKTITRKLTPGQGIACDPSDVSVVVNETNPHVKWSIKTYESD